MKSRKIIEIANKFLSRYNRKIIRDIKIDRDERRIWVREFLLKQSKQNIEKVLSIEDGSKSQLKQDLFVLLELDFKTNGFFVEFGAMDGIEISNTYLLEREFGWKGILSEPAKKWQKRLKRNRNCFIETDCVWKNSNEQIEFFESKAGELSTIGSFKNVDTHRREKHKVYNVQTISLMDMLKKYNAPSSIDYLSLDTEGSEFEILNSFDFNEYNIKAITVEHNHTPMRKKIFDLLTEYGYTRKYVEVSNCDDWYVRM